MYFVFSFKNLPKPLRVIGPFKGPNPWNENQPKDWPEDWSLEEFLMVNAAHAHQFDSVSQDLWNKKKRLYGGYKVIGIRSLSDGRYHILPASLMKLWENKQVRAEELPRLLHSIEPSLKDIDFKPIVGSKGRFWFSLCSFLILSLLTTLLTVFASSSLEFPEKPDPSWLRSSMKEGEWVNTKDTITLEDVTFLSDFRPETQRKPFLEDSPAQYSLGWFQAAHEKRLALINRYDSHTAYLLFGTTHSPEVLGISDFVIKDLKERVENLNSSQVLVWGEQEYRRVFHRPNTFFVVFSLCMYGGSLFPLIFVFRFRKRVEEQIKRIKEIL